MLVWVIDADDDGYWLTDYALVQSLPVFVGILLLAELLEITEVCECVFE